jgi:hypothetical protein
MNIYREVLAEEPGNAFALLGAARVLVDRFEDAANSYLQPLIEGTAYNDGALVGALLLVAQVALENNRYDEAVRDAIATPSICIKRPLTQSRVLPQRMKSWASTCCATTR